MNRPTENKDPLDQFTEAFASLRVPAGPSLKVKQDLLDRLPESPATQSVPFWREKNMRRYVSFAAALLLILGLATYLQPPIGGGPGAAFAAMLEQIKEIRTATFTVTASLDGSAKVTSRSSLLEPSWMRQELMLNGKLVAIQIINQESGKMLALEPANKKALLIDTSGVPDNPQQKSIIESFKELPADVAVFEGEEFVDSVATLKYVYDLSGMNYAVWLHAESKMPVKITMADHVDPEKAQFHVTMTDFVWGPDLDESLFTLDLPEGYAMKKQSIDFSKGTEQDLVTMFRIYARLNDGKFPNAWNALTPATMGKLMTLPEGTKKEKKSNAMQKMALALGKPEAESYSKAEQELFTTEFQQVVIAGAVYFSKVMESNDWHYQGRGVELGEKEKIVAWWYPKKDKAEEGADLDTAHVLYGDLRIEKMPVAELTKSDAK